MSERLRRALIAVIAECPSGIEEPQTAEGTVNIRISSLRELILAHQEATK